MSFDTQRELYLQKLRYKYFAYCVVRDAIGFYFGIPKFLQDVDFNEVVRQRLTERTEARENVIGRLLSDKEKAKYRKSIEKSVRTRIYDLEEDYRFCEQVLFEDNIWLQHLDLDPNFFKNYLPSLPDTTKDQLAVVPNWTTRDHSLGRPYLVDNKNAASIAF